MSKKELDQLNELLKEEIESIPEDISYSAYQVGFTAPFVYGITFDKEVLNKDSLTKKFIENLIITKLGFEGDNKELINLCYRSWEKYREYLYIKREKLRAKEQKEEERLEKLSKDPKANFKSRKK